MDTNHLQDINSRDINLHQATNLSRDINLHQATNHNLATNRNHRL